MDQGSCTEIYSTFKKLGLLQEALERSMTPLVGFSAHPVCHMGKVTIPVRTGSVVLQTEFLVVDVPSSYNAIIGRTRLHRMKAISSTYHRMLKFPGSNRVEFVRGIRRWPINIWYP